MKQITTTLILLGSFSWSNATAQTQEQQHKHEQHEEVKQAPPDKRLSKGEMKQKIKEKMKDMKCCPTEEQKEPKS